MQIVALILLRKIEIDYGGSAIDVLIIKNYHI